MSVENETETATAPATETPAVETKEPVENSIYKTMEKTAEEEVKKDEAPAEKQEDEAPAEKQEDGDTILGKKDDEESEGDDKKESSEEKKDEESYDFKVPEGMEVQPELMDGFKSFAKEHGVSQEKAQEFLSTHLESQQKAQQEAFDATVTGWADAAKSDVEIGGEKFDENTTLAKTALKKLGEPALLQALEQSGMGSHPEIIRLLVRAGKMMSDGDMMAAGANSTKPKELATSLYPSMKGE